MNVIPFPTARVVIDGGIITSSVLIDADGRHELASEIGGEAYFVRVEAPHFSEAISEHGTHGDALAAANEAAHEHRCRIIDRTGVA